MTFYWLKYMIRSRGSNGVWQWKAIGNQPDEQTAFGEAQFMIEDIETSECYAESYKIAWVVEDWAPTRVISSLLESADSQARSYQGLARTYSLLLSSGAGKECPQCSEADPYGSDLKGGPKRRLRACPTCGRNVYEDSLPYLLPKKQKDALKLLGILADGGPQTDAKWNAKYREVGEDALSPLQWLIDLGLAGGTCGAGSNKTLWEATENGKAEWEKSKHRSKPKKG